MFFENIVKWDGVYKFVWATDWNIIRIKSAFIDTQAADGSPRETIRSKVCFKWNRVLENVTTSFY